MKHIRPFDREGDLDAVLELVGRTRARAEAGAIFHPGGLQWWLRRLGRPTFDVTVLLDDEDLVGLALRDGGDVIVQADRAHAQDRTGLLAFVEVRARRAGQTELLVSVPEEDDDLRATVLALGYAPSDRSGFELVHELAEDPGRPDLPRGFQMTSLTPALADAYVALHRAAWSRPDAPSTYDRTQHDVATAMPDFRYDLVPIVAGPDGALASYCISWWDPRSSSVEIEPLGTHPDFRRRGLARAIVREVLRRAWSLKARYVLVWGTSDNPEAEALYRSAGLRVSRRLRDYRAGTA